MRNFILITLLFFTLILSGCLKKDTVDHSWLDVEKQGVFVLGLDDSFPPMGYLEPESGKITGFDIDLAEEVCDRLGITLKIQPISWVTKELELINGNVDCLWNGLSKTEELEEKLNLSFPYMRNRQCILVKSDSNVNNLVALKGKRFVVQQESSAEHALNKFPNFKDSLEEIVEVSTYLRGFMELNNNTADALGIDEIVARFYIKNNDNYRLLKNVNNQVISLSDEDYVIAFRKKDNALKEKVESVLLDMRNDGTLANISIKWFGEDITTVGES